MDEWEKELLDDRQTVRQADRQTDRGGLTVDGYMER